MKTKELQKFLRESNVIFNEEAHSYTHKITGELYTGCTTISGAYKKDFLAPWYASEAVKSLGWYSIYEDGKKKSPEQLALDKLRFEQFFQELKDVDSGDYFSLLANAKDSAIRKADQAKHDGKLAHSWMEKAIGIKISGKKAKLPVMENEAQRNSVESFKNFWKGRNVTWLACEEVLHHPLYKVAGMIDAIASIDGLLYVVDHKTSKQISEDALIQCAGYSLMLKDMGLTVQGIMVVRYPKDGKEAEFVSETDREKIEWYEQIFLHLREAHRYFVPHTKNNLKDERGKMIVEKIEKPKKVVRKIDIGIKGTPIKK